MATLIQSATASTAGGGATSIGATWPAATTKGNLLVMMLALHRNGSDPTSVVPPSNWDNVLSNNLATVPWWQIWAIGEQAGGSRSGTETVTWSVAKKAVLILAEIRTEVGVRVVYGQANPIGLGSAGTVTIGTGTGTTVAGVATVVSELPISFGVYGHACENAETFSSPSSGFSIAAQIQGAGSGGAGTKISAALLYGGKTTGAALTCQTTIGASREWIAGGMDLGNVSLYQSLTGVGY